MNSAHPTNILHGQDLLSGPENLLIENFAKTCGAVPAAEALSRFLAEAFGLDLATDPDIVVGFASDESHLPGSAAGVCRPRTRRDVAIVLRACFRCGNPVAAYLQVPAAAAEADALAEAWFERLCGLGVDPDAILLLDNDRDRSLFLEARHSMPANSLEVVNRRGTFTLMTDTVVPRDRFAEFLAFAHALLAENAIDYLAFGHLGDCHLHFSMMPERSQLEDATRVYETIVAKSAALGGVYSGEHGTGKRKRADFVACNGERGVEDVRRTKAAIDPAFLLNRGNVVTAPACV